MIMNIEENRVVIQKMIRDLAEAGTPEEEIIMIVAKLLENMYTASDSFLKQFGDIPYKDKPSNKEAIVKNLTP